MENPTREAELRAFLFWIRTGRRMAEPFAAQVERKFNPWHDPRNGQFTFGPGGADFQGGGGRTGGAGASGAWDRSAPATARQASAGTARAGEKDKGAADRRQPIGRSDAARLEQLRRAAAAAKHGRFPSRPRRVVERNGYRYAIDPANRTLHASGSLSFGPMSPRSRTVQARAGGADRRAGDDGGHYIARRFNGPSDAFNHFAQSAQFNRGSYRALEDSWARALRQGKSVFVQIAPHYQGRSQRPAWLRVTWTVDGFTKGQVFRN